MTEDTDDRVPCDHCGELYDRRGIGAHEASCSEASSDEDTSAPSDTTDADPEWGGVELEVLERDNGQCRRCGSDEDLVVHVINRAILGKRSNLVTLCADCEAEIEGLHYRTKRTAIQGVR